MMINAEPPPLPIYFQLHSSIGDIKYENQVKKEIGRKKVFEINCFVLFTD